MTVELEEFTQWRHRVDARLGRLEVMSDEHVDKGRQQDGLLGSMDTDLSNIQVEFRAQRGLLQALHVTQNEHTAMLRDHTDTLRDHTARLARLESGQQELRREVTEVRVGVQTIIGLLSPADGDEESGGTSPN